MRAFWAFMSVWKPEIRVAGGDHFDFRHLRAKAGEGERYESGQLDFQHGLDFLRKFKPTHVAWGNHDDRAWQLLSSPTMKKPSTSGCNGRWGLDLPANPPAA